MPTSPLFLLDIQTDIHSGSVQLRLSNQEGMHLASHDIRLADHRPVEWEGVFDTRNHIRRMELIQDEAESIRTIGKFIAQVVLGRDIMRCLAAGEHQRTLVARLPDVTTDPLCAAFARIPWEIARPENSERTLLRRNLVVRVAPAGACARGVEPIRIAPGEPLRVLLIFAAAPGSRPLAMRFEREELQQLFWKEVLPVRDVQIDVLCHGVTRSSIRQNVRERGGYHIVHWSGHGRHDFLEIELEEGETAPPHISGADFVSLFSEAGGFIPLLTFLGACHSGALLTARDWPELHTRLSTGSSAREAPSLHRLLAGGPGYTGTALALLQAGVRQVVAMRYEVGDAYAQRLARLFYRGILAEPAHHSVDAALAIARREIAEDAKRAREYSQADHATPLAFGETPIRLIPASRRSQQMNSRAPRPQPLLPNGSHDLERPANFVGRTMELTQIQRQWSRTQRAPITVLQGLAGLGKTALAAEAIHLWHHRFKYVIAFQARSGPLDIEDFYRQFDSRLALASQWYRDRCAENELAKVYIPPRSLGGTPREEALRNNLIDVLRDEAILLVLDNFETNLRSVEGPNGYASSDPAWDRLLASISERIADSGTRVLISTRHRLAALPSTKDAHWVLLGPLPIADAVLFFQGCPPLRELLYGHDADKLIAQRILDVTRGHPLILQLIADLALSHYSQVRGLSASGRVVLQDALARIRGKGYAALPDLFTGGRTDAEKEQVRVYLEDVAIGAVDLLLQRLSSDARQLLWVITRAREPIPDELLSDVWSGVSLEEDIARKMVDHLQRQEEMLPHERAEFHTALAELHKFPEFREHIEALQKPHGGGTESPQISPLLDELIHAGLICRQETPGGLIEYTFHELVAERTSNWMQRHPETPSVRTEEQLSKAYGDRYAMMFEGLLRAGVPGGRDAAAECGARSIRYLARGRAFKRLSEFAGRMVADIADTPMLGQVIADLQRAVEEAPAGKIRFALQASLADAFRAGNQLDQAIQLYGQAAEQAELAAEWDLLGWIYSQWSGTLVLSGQYKQALHLLKRSVEARRRAGRPRADILAAELEVLRLNIINGHPSLVLGDVFEIIQELRPWWHRWVRGESVVDIAGNEPDRIVNSFITALDVGCQLALSLQRWQICDDLILEMIKVESSRGAGEHALAELQMRRGAVLTKLGRLQEARASLEECMEIFRHVGSTANQASCLDHLASIWDDLADPHQARLMGQAALHIWNGLALPMERASTHHNISLYMHDAGEIAAAGFHWLAGFVYCCATGYDNAPSIGGLQRHLRRSISGGYDFQPPRIAEMLARPEFAPLRQFLASHEMSDKDLDDIQHEVDELVKRHKIVMGAVVPVPLPPGALCLCESGLPFLECHGAPTE